MTARPKRDRILLYYDHGQSLTPAKFRLRNTSSRGEHRSVALTRSRFHLPAYKLQLALDYKWITAAVAWTAFFMTSFGRENWLLLIPFASKELLLSKVDAGLYVSSFYIAYILAQIPGGLIGDRYGSKWIICAGLLGTGASSIGLAWVSGIVEGLVLRFLGGMSSGLIFGPCVRLLSQWFSKGRIGTAIGIFLTGPTVSLVALGVILPPITLQFGWRYALSLTGFVVAVGAVVVAVYGREGTRASPTDRRASEEPSPSPKDKLPSFFKSSFSVLKNREFCFCGLTTLFSVAGYWGVTIWLLDYFVTGLSIPVVVSGGLLSVYGIGSIINKPVVGLVQDRFAKNTYSFTAVSLIGLAVSISCLPIITDLLVLYAYVFMIGVFSTIPTQLLLNIVVQISDQRSTGISSSINNLIGRVGVVIASVQFGYVYDLTRSYSLGWLTIALMPLIGLIFLSQSQKVNIGDHRLSKGLPLATGYGNA